MSADKKLHCSFCAKHPDEVDVMIIGALGNICNECADLCNDIISRKRDQLAEIKALGT